MTMVAWRYGAWFAAFLCTVAVGNAQEEAEDSPFRPGLVATYSAGGQSVTRVDEVVAFEWLNASADQRLLAGEFKATWRGRLWARGAGEYRLSCYVQGEVAVKLAGKTLIEGRSDQPAWLESPTVALDFDHHLLEISYRRSTPQGQVKLFWTGPDFRMEPLPAWALVHERESSPSAAFERGRELAAALRCAACHKDGAALMVAAPALDRLSGNVNQTWLLDWLASHGERKENESSQRMPDLGMSREEAVAVAAWLLREPAVKVDAQVVEQKEAKAAKEDSTSTKSADSKSKKKKGEEKPKPSAEEGEKLVLTRGCLACHQVGELGLSGLFGGGDLTGLFQKRPADFLTRWLADPAAVNRDHRMPVFQFAADEIASLGLWAKRESSVGNALRSVPSAGKNSTLVSEGKKLVESLKCAACHSLSRDKPALLPADQEELTASSDWSRSCARQARSAMGQPVYRLIDADAAAIKAYYSAARLGAGRLSSQARGRDLLAELNCLACHQREGVERGTLAGVGGPAPANTGLSHPALPALQDKLAAIAEAHGELATLVPAMTPPALNSVGDKLQDEALKDSILRKGRPHRPYLLVQMPKFELSKEQLGALTAYFVATDRIPPHGAGLWPAIQNTAGQRPAPQALAAAGPRLVTTDGLACTSCHQVGSVLPTKAPLNARGPDMSLLGSRIRREWFDRWCNNPARIVPRMEMPAVKIPVRGVLNDNVEDQLAAVWHILNTPGFEPPEPDPVRVLRLSGIPEKNERPIVLHDVVKDGDKTYLFPLVIGLPNRHNVLFDLETNRLAAWWLGDTARQRTKGKSWYWEMGGKSILAPDFDNSEITLVIDGKVSLPEAKLQFANTLDAYGTTGYDGTPLHEPQWIGRLSFAASKVPLKDGGPEIQLECNHLVRTFPPPPELTAPGTTYPSTANGFIYDVFVRGRGKPHEVRFRLLSPQLAANSAFDATSGTITLAGNGGITIRLPSIVTGKIGWNGDGTVSVISPSISRSGMWTARFYAEYSTALPVDQYLGAPPPPRPTNHGAVQIAPGIEGSRLPLSGDVMPSAFSWTRQGKLLFPTLKGEVWSTRDSDGDGLEDESKLIADGLATPYGIQALDNGDIDVVAKDGLLRLMYLDAEDRATRVETIASGWGMTEDYHDWAVGLIRDPSGEYYVALPCQQDQRTERAADLRGRLVKFLPRSWQLDNPRRFDIEIISAGHRFPMGMARNREGELFVTDNQGNYNPFNELNHVKNGAHFGFINALEKEKGFVPPPLTEPAINIPHPWTRSVNGICFLDTPQPKPNDDKLYAPRKSIYGPLEGHLVGCEYDTRRLIRMSLDKVNGEYQGCCYPLSIPPADVEKGLLGPIVCAIKPTTGELYVGEIRDSGWGASNNIGQITKIKIEPEKLPCGIAKVRATKNGFVIDFFKPVDRAKAANLDSYAIESYRRESTPAYGGPDIDRRPEKIASASLSEDGKHVTLVLPELRTRHVYELRLKNLTQGGGVFHPDEAHYTLKQVPEGNDE
jgi:mono/diheme cytochrome c family protein